MDELERSMPPAQSNSIDTITREVLRHKFEAIADEMQTTLVRSAYSPIIKETEDATSCIFDREGRTIAQATANPGHQGMLIPAVQAILEEFPSREMTPGDIFIFNDPYYGGDDAGGTHIPDVTIAKPIFLGEEHVAIAANMGHHQDFGGMVPGSLPTSATEIYQEGLRLPPMRLYDGGERVESIFSIIEKNVRIPEVVRGDINAQISGLNITERRFEELANEYDSATIFTVFDELIKNAEAQSRSNIDRIPDGSYSFVDFIDDDGVDMHEPIRLEAEVVIDGSEIRMDFTGSADQVKGPINSVPASTMSTVYYMMSAITTPDIRPNAGTFEPVSAHLPEGSILNPEPPAPVNARAVTLKRLMDVLVGAFAQAVPEEIPAAGLRPFTAIGFGGNADGDNWVYGEVLAGGTGGRPHTDGVDCVDIDTTNAANTLVEPAEMDYPIRIHEYELWENSAGPGQYRGGFGCIKRFEVLADDISMIHRRDRHDFQPWGLNGGKAAPACKTRVITDKDDEWLPSMIVKPLDSGDVMEVFTTGGGGYGDPDNRPLAAIDRDLKREKITPEHAREVYNVPVTETGRIDYQEAEERSDDVDPIPKPGEAIFDRGNVPLEPEQ